MARSSTPKEAVAQVSREIPWKPFAVLAVIALAVVALVMFDPQPPGTEFANAGNIHISDPAEPHSPYNSAPPSSGPHLGVLANWGVHEDPVPAELFVHNLEDGGVVFTYDCPDGCDDLVGELTTIVEDGSRRLLTGYDGISLEGTDFRAAAVAWTRVYYFDELTDDVRGDLNTFLSLYEGLDHHVRTN
ncbi:MAG: DUF3105 domain-containing protein [Acidimicrobiia bacterium]|nr:DUF3105 domain-containing protein [Acidimicrobiia bacterium]MDH4308606.1 DUF3105 domain-containing protein [Acidimicrobiia bacterium]MDH5294518.1 DUF3105 domain-containing protein [Acidimicrobiia bacterium]